jgi:hypothetical protein
MKSRTRKLTEDLTVRVETSKPSVKNTRRYSIYVRKIRNTLPAVFMSIEISGNKMNTIIPIIDGIIKGIIRLKKPPMLLPIRYISLGTLLDIINFKVPFSFSPDMAS